MDNFFLSLVSVTVVKKSDTELYLVTLNFIEWLLTDTYKVIIFCTAVLTIQYKQQLHIETDEELLLKAFIKTITQKF